MKALIKLVIEKIKLFILRTLTFLIKDKYGKMSTICTIWCDKKIVKFQTGITRGQLSKENNIGIVIRKLVGQNMLMTYGIQENPPVVVLVPSLNLIFKLGLIKYIKLIKNWKGQSMVGDTVVVKYKVFF